MDTSATAGQNRGKMDGDYGILGSTVTASRGLSSHSQCDCSAMIVRLFPFPSHRDFLDSERERSHSTGEFSVFLAVVIFLSISSWEQIAFSDCRITFEVELRIAGHTHVPDVGPGWLGGFEKSQASNDHRGRDGMTFRHIYLDLMSA